MEVQVPNSASNITQSGSKDLLVIARHNWEFSFSLMGKSPMIIPWLGEVRCTLLFPT
jgi:hypothetical protein